MPVINIALEDLNRMLKDKLSAADFASIIPKIGADPDEINDSEAIVEFFPDRPDLLSTAVSYTHLTLPTKRIV